MRRAVWLVVASVALTAALPAAAQVHVRKGTIPRTTTRVRVVVSLALPPLALHGSRGLASAVARRRLDATDAAARAYVARVASAQARAVADLRTAIPQARVGRRFQVVLDALTVSLPASRLPALLHRPWAVHVYPSLQYRLATDRSPSVIGADVLHAATGADGTGMKIAVVDDGVDQTNPFFAPAGFAYPPGFPKGDTAATTPKVIVARVFPGPGAGAAGRRPVDPASSFHGTHVAGIAAGDAGTTAPAGADHPRVTGLSGVAPRAWLGNYRVFTVPTPIGHVADTPEIVAAFEAAVKDGMDVINFSGGGPEVEPADDALVAAVHAVAAAGVVPVIAAGNDRDDFGVGSVGSPGTAPDAISVAAVSNTHVFAPALDVTAPGGPTGIPFRGAAGELAPVEWGTRDQTLVDVGSLAEPHLCGAPLPEGSLAGAIALVRRGICPFAEKTARAKAAGAVGIVFADNREGEANTIPVQLALPAGMVSNLDGARLAAFADARGGRTTIRVGRAPLELETGRSGVITSFSSGGPTAFRHDLKPDVSAPGGQILSSTLPRTDPSRFAVFDGTSMATPHVAGAAALLLELHRSWTPAQVKSALVTSAGPAWADTARTREAAVPLEGGGLVSLPAATDPRVFAEPASLSFEDVAPGGARTLLVHVTDAGGGAGSWTVSVDPQASTGAAVDAAGMLALAPGGSADLAVTASAPAAAANGENYGFVVLRDGEVTRRIPYLVFVDRPALADAPVLPLVREQSGTTAVGTSRVERYRYPSAPFGFQPETPPMVEDGAEQVYELRLPAKAVNAGVSVLDTGRGARIDPWFLGRKDESTVQGYAGTPVDVNELTYDYQEAVGAAGASFPAAGTYYVAVDSGRAQFTNRRLAGRYVLRSWVNDVTPPTLRLLTTRVAAGRPTLVFRTTDAQSGVDPRSLTLGVGGALLSVGTYDRTTGLAVFPLPRGAAALRTGTTRVRMISSDYQETKNVDTSGRSIMPNTRTASGTLHVVARVAVDWLLPASGTCAAPRTRLEVAAGAPAGVARVRFAVDGRRAAVDRRATDGLWSATVRLPRGRHVLAATAVDRKGRSATVQRMVRTCGG
ncbi:MAG TPA: S8 family serine peptidase [Gaiellaceae bacterium]|nr:S8 family serine peptidase [Gaiellaceae bacterium]